MTSPTNNIPPYPKLRPLDIRPVVLEGDQHYLALRDPLGLASKELLIPQALAALLALCDGTRDLATLRTALMLRTNLTLSPTQLEGLLAQLDEALLLEGQRFAEVCAQALESYRKAPYRMPALAGKSYSANPQELEGLFEAVCRSATAHHEGDPPGPASVAGIISPHIDYARGGRVYAQAWQQVVPALRDVEQVIILGTDHAGSPGRLTLTRQSYATPWGALPTAVDVVDSLAKALGPEEAYAEELHHTREHSIELATIWLHYFLGDRRPSLVPVLCGHFGPFVSGERDPEREGPFARALEVLQEAMQQKKSLVVAAADLAHVGPAFGDRLPLDVAGRASQSAADRVLLDAVAAGSASQFFKLVQQERDSRRICGLAPIYLALRLLGGSGIRGEVVDYALCPADPEGGSLVSIASVVLRRD